MNKRIGILGGISHESTIKYYELILKKYFEKFKNYYYPEIVIFSLDFQKFTDFEDKKDIDGYIDYIMEGINSLQNSKVDFIIMAANSPHAVFDSVKEKAKVPMLSIAEVTAENARKQGIKKLLLLGIKFTMQSTFYQKVCNSKEIEVITPNETTGPIQINNSLNCNGCELDSKCYPFGYRKGGNFCSDSNNIFIEQKQSDVSCENNFECSSNLCIDNQCMSGSIWQKFLSWFKRLFGG